MLQALKTRRTREQVIQGIVLVLTLGLLVTFILTTRHNLLAQGIATGFGFLERSTGWPINFSLIEISARSPYWRMLVAGLLNTLLVGFIGLALATVVGVAMGLARISSNFVLNMIGTTYVEVFRNVPLILQVFVWYAVLTHLPIPRNAISLAGFGFISNRGLMLPALDMTATDILVLCVAGAVLIYAALRIRKAEAAAARPVWTGVALGLVALFTVLLLTGRTPDSPLLTLPELRGLRFVGGIEIKPEFSALLIAITVFGGAYVGEIVRGGFLAVDRGKIEAARALGLSGFQINRFVRIPLAVRAALPAMANQYIWLMKATTLGIAIGYPDYFMVVSTSINQSGQTIELLALLMGGFLLVNYAISWVMNRINDRLAIKGKAG
ncbi:MAG: ABC transporter permease subunit [Alphaproteobacteria bacterium]|nr:ABC transporter permease subunit [Alphaproteobacteria bacterium]